jgi:hypothetical protein
MNIYYKFNQCIDEITKEDLDINRYSDDIEKFCLIYQIIAREIFPWIIIYHTEQSYASFDKR